MAGQSVLESAPPPNWCKVRREMSVWGAPCRKLWFGLLLCVGSAQPLLGQETRPAPVAIDTVASFDEAADFQGNYATGITADALVSVGLGRGLEGVIWPIVQRLGSGQWNHDLWIASVRVPASRSDRRARRGRARAVAGRAGNYIGRRPHLNPTISQPSSLFTSLPALEPAGTARQPPRRGISVRRTGHTVGTALGMVIPPSSTRRPFDDVESFSHEPTPIHECRSWWGRHADRRPHHRRVRHAGRLDARWRRPRRHR